MKTLKKSLCLVLAVVMVVGVLAVSASAATYPDDNDIEYKEAVEVLTLIGVISGGDNGFAPKATLTREQAAKIITYIVNQKSAESLAKTCAFTDVANGWWSAGYIAYCSAQGIISGWDGKFAPSGTLTGTAWAKMLLTALGYSAASEGYTGDNWEVNVVSKAEELGLANGISSFDYSANITREEACQMALNALNTQMVKYANSGSNITISGGDTNVSINTGSSAAEGVTTTVNGNIVPVTLRSRYFSGLSVAPASANVTDEYGRPATRYSYEKDGKTTTVTAASQPVATYTNGNQGKFSSKNNYENYTIPNNVTVKVNGIVASWDDSIKNLKGVTVEFFDTDKDKTIDVITVMQSTIAQVSAVSTRNDGSITLKVGASSHKIENDKDDKNDLYDQLTAAGYGKNDYLLVYIGEDKDGNDTVLGFTDVDTVEGTATRVVGATDTAGTTAKVTVGGSVYETASNFVSGTVKNAVHVGSSILTEKVVLYINECGYVAAAASEDVSTDTLYGVVLDYGSQAAQSGSLVGNTKTSIEKIKIFTADGETVIFETTSSGITAEDWADEDYSFVGSNSLIGELVTYTLDGDKVDSISADDTRTSNVEEFNNKIALALGDKYATSTTLMFVTNTEHTKAAVYTGYAAAPNASGTITYISNKAVLITVTGSIPGAVTKEQYVVVTDNTISTVYDSNLKRAVYTVDAITPDGTEVTLTWKSTTAPIVVKGIYTYTTEDGYVRGWENKVNGAVTTTEANKVSTSTADFIVAGSNIIYINDKTEIYEVSINNQKNITDSVESDSVPASNESDYVYVVLVGGSGTSANPASIVFYVVD